MTEENHRSVEISRLSKGRFVARNERGGELEFGVGGDAEFSPVELLLVAIAGCSAIDVDYLTTKRVEPDRFVVAAEADKIRDEHGNRLKDLLLRFDVAFPQSEDGTAARERLPSALQHSHDRLCTVSRTVEVGTPVETRLAGAEQD